MRKSSVARSRQPYAGDADAKGIFAEMPGEWRALRWDLAEYAPDCHSFLWSANRKWLKKYFRFTALRVSRSACFVFLSREIASNAFPLVESVEAKLCYASNLKENFADGQRLSAK